MLPHKLANAAAGMISVTATATLLYDLITTAGSTAHGLPNDLNECVIQPEDGQIRILIDGNTPTGTQGELITVGEKKTIKGPLHKMRLIRENAETSNVSCSVKPGWQDIHVN
jgi:hypothetical protein